MTHQAGPSFTAHLSEARRPWLLVTVLGTGLLVSACNLVSLDDSDSPRQELQRNRALWSSQALGAYQYREYKGCECVGGFIGPVVISVEDNEIVAVVEAQTGDPVSEDEWSAFDNLDELFDLVAQALDEDAHVLEVDYDPDRGFPTRINVDFRSQIADDEMLILATELAPSG